MKLSFNSFLIFTTLVVYTITAYNSVGFFHADEHYQIIEFAGLKCGWNTPNDLSWEYHDQIRSGIQPTLAYWLISLFNSVGISDPYTVSFLLRELTGISMILALLVFYKNTNRFIKSTKFPQYDKSLKVLYLFLLLLIWYIPYLGIRFSSETWSAIFLIAAMGTFYSEKKTTRTLLLTGAFFGFSFLFRFQIAFALVGFGLNYLIFGKEKFKTSLLILAGFSIILLCGVFIDYWFYETWSFTPWNYFWTFFKSNVLSNQGYNFGTESWDYYFNQMFQLPTKLIGSLIILSLTTAIIFKGRSIILWMIISFILAHLFITHKEERFLFPIVFFLPLFFLNLFQILIDFTPRKISLTLISLTSLGILITSIVGIPVMATKPAGLGRNGITQYIHEEFSNQPVNLIAMPYSNPYSPWFLDERFYMDKNVSFKSINQFEELDSTVLKKDTLNLFVTTVFFLEKYPKKERIQGMGFRLIKKSVSDHELKLNKYIQNIDDESVIYLYQKK